MLLQRFYGKSAASKSKGVLLEFITTQAAKTHFRDRVMVVVESVKKLQRSWRRYKWAYAIKFQLLEKQISDFQERVTERAV